MRHILILGAYSAIAAHAARHFAADGDALFLAGKNEEKLRVLADDLKLRGASKTGWIAADMNDFEKHPVIWKQAKDALGDIDTLLIAHGKLSDQKYCSVSYANTEEVLRNDFLSAVSFLVPVANEFERKGSGTIAAITSVAADKARPEHYTYAAAKAGLSSFMQGLRNRFGRTNVRVITIKPGFIDTPMTAHFKKSFITASAATAGKGVYDAIVKKKEVAYTPGFWRIIMALVQLTPEAIFKKLPHK